MLLVFFCLITFPEKIMHCRFYLCLWYKDDPNSQQKFMYYVARLKSQAIVRDSGSLSSLMTRELAKKLTLALGQNSSFSRGFDKILQVLLVGKVALSPFFSKLNFFYTHYKMLYRQVCERTLQSFVQKHCEQ